jgi:hypothetical protein
MNIDDLCAELDRDLDLGLSGLATYAKQIVESEDSVSHLAERFNGELPPRIEDLERSFVSNLQSRLGDLGEDFVRELDAKTRIKYYDAEIERSVTKGLIFSCWTEWHQDITQKVQTAAAGCAVAAGVGVGLSLAKAVGILTIRIPLLLGSAPATMLFFVAIACAASAVAIRPDGLPIVLEHERNRALNHVDGYLKALKRELTQVARRVAENALIELDKLRTTSNEHPQSP